MRKVLAWCLPALLAAGVVAAADAPAKVDGSWEVTSEGRQGPMTQTLTLKQEGDKLTGTLKGMRGEAPVEGSVTGQEIKFTVKRETPRGPMTLEYKGSVDGDSMKGTLETPMGARDWTAKRAKADPQ